MTDPNEELAKKLIRFGAHDAGNAEAVIALYGDRIAYTAGMGWLWYTGTHWENRVAEATINSWILETFKTRAKLSFTAKNGEPDNALFNASRPSASNRNNCRAMLQDLVETIEEDFDNQPDLLNVKNGVINLRTGELLPHAPTPRFTYCVPIDYDPAAGDGEGMATWERFLCDVLAAAGQDEPDPEIVSFLQMAVGYSLTGLTSEEVFFYLFGPTRSGKSTFLRVLLELLGKPLATGVSFSTFTKSRDGDNQNFDLAPLKPCRLISASESSQYTKINSPHIKAITGGEPIYCAHKGRPHFSYLPQFKIWLSSNFRLNMNVDDDAAWARPIRFTFPNSYLGKEDKKLKERLTSPAVLSAVLTWAVEGARRWYQAPRGLVPPASVVAALEEDRAAHDYIGQFLEEHGYSLVRDPAAVEERRAWLPSSDVYSDYALWCDSEGYPKKNQGNFVAALKHRGFKTGRKSYQGKQQRCLIGVAKS